MKAEALYVPEGDLVVPTEYTTGPWSPDAQHGGPVSALMTRAVECFPADRPMQLVRMTIELVRPVPLRPLRVETRLSRPGRNVQLVDVYLYDGEVEVTRARGLRIRQAEVPVPAPADDFEVPPVPESRFTGEGLEITTRFLDAVDLRFVKGGWDRPGPATGWGRLLVPVVAGEEATASQQAAALADFGNAFSKIVDFATHTFINPDLTVAFARPPTGKWIGLDSVSQLSPNGWGHAESQLFDKDGVVGRSVQSLLITQR